MWLNPPTTKQTLCWVENPVRCTQHRIRIKLFVPNAGMYIYVIYYNQIFSYMLMSWLACIPTCKFKLNINYYNFNFRFDKKKSEFMQRNLSIINITCTCISAIANISFPPPPYIHQRNCSSPPPFGTVVLYM